ncbi:ABC transporter ATP-binding protein [Aerococcus urinaeequi]|uniref:ABC transporter ATP-binding protein n=2 Tax=Aerococcus urinaeequi TaxID=51665 RepID=UPI003AB0A743
MLEIKNIKKSYQNNLVLDIDQLQINSGQIFCYLGTNGAGKTTTIELITGIEEPDEGEIKLNSKSLITKSIDVKMNIAYVPDKPILYDHLTGREQLEFMRQVYQLSKDEFNLRVDRLIALFQFENYLSKNISEYSKGTKQKLQLISILIQDVPLYILDEPFSGLDAQSIESLKLVLKELAKKGAIVFISTHLLDVVLDIGDSGVYLQNGKIIEVFSDKDGLYKLKSLMQRHADAGM